LWEARHSPDLSGFRRSNRVKKGFSGGYAARKPLSFRAAEGGKGDFPHKTTELEKIEFTTAMSGE